MRKCRATVYRRPLALRPLGLAFADFFPRRDAVRRAARPDVAVRRALGFDLWADFTRALAFLRFGAAFFLALGTAFFIARAFRAVDLPDFRAAFAGFGGCDSRTSATLVGGSSGTDGPVKGSSSSSVSDPKSSMPLSKLPVRSSYSSNSSSSLIQ